MTENNTTMRLSTGKLILGLAALAVAVVCLALVLVHRAKAQAWSGADTGLSVVAALLAVVAAYVFAPTVQSALNPRAEAQPAMPATIGLALLLLGLGSLAVLLVNRVAGQPWGKADTILAVVALLGLVAAAVVWWEPLARGLGSRGVLLQVNAGVVAALVLGILVILNYTIIPRHFASIKADLTEGKYYTLSDQTEKIVKQIAKDNPVELLLLIDRSRTADNQDVHSAMKRIEDYDRLSAHLTSKVLDPNIDLEARQLREEGALSVIPGVLVRFKNQPTMREGVDGYEEQDITRGLLKLLNPSSRKLYFLTGHGEMPREAAGGQNSAGMGIFTKILENDRYETADLDLRTSAAVPTDAAAVIAVAPRLPASPPEVQKLEAYLGGGGRLLAFIDPLLKSNLGDVLKKYGIVWHPSVVDDPTMSLMGAGAFFSQTYTEHEAVRIFSQYKLPVAFFGAGYFTQDTAAGSYELTELIKTQSPGKVLQGPDTTASGPFTLLMLSSTKDPEPPADDKSAATPPDTKRIRVAAVADGDFVNDQLSMFGDVANPQVAANLVAWLTDNTQVIGIRAKNPMQDEQNRKITLDDKGKRWVVLLTLFMPLALIVAAGIGMRIARR
ncbi:MAG: GldG family protein [Armatimonadetes bacterium]|nr:GldG family protein [Armatimonadota bacterium]